MGNSQIDPTSRDKSLRKIRPSFSIKFVFHVKVRLCNMFHVFFYTVGIATAIASYINLFVIIRCHIMITYCDLSGKSILFCMTLMSLS